MESRQERWSDILAQLGARRSAAAAMGGAERVARQHGSGKLDACARAHALFDPGSFYKIGVFAGALERAPSAPADGLIADFGHIAGRPALAAAEDFTVLGGSIGDSGADKRYRLNQLAAQERVPLVYLLEGAGPRPDNAHVGGRPNDLQGLASLSGRCRSSAPYSEEQASGALQVANRVAFDDNHRPARPAQCAAAGIATGRITQSWHRAVSAHRRHALTQKLCHNARRCTIFLRPFGDPHALYPAAGLRPLPRLRGDRPHR